MKAKTTATITAASLFFFGTSAAVLAQSTKSPDTKAPAQQTQQKSKSKETTGQTSPGASGTSPGHQMQQEGQPGASGYAPGKKKGSTGGMDD